MATITITAPAASPAVATISLETSSVADGLVKLGSNPTGKNSVARFQAIFALLITEINRIPPASSVPSVPLPVPGNDASSVVAGLLVYLDAVVKLAEAAPDFN